MLKKASMDISETRKNPTPYDVESNVESFHWLCVVRRKLLRSILSSLEAPKNCVALEVGCGTGSNLRTLRSAGVYPIGLDQSIYALTLVRKKGEYPVLAGDLNDLPIKTKSVG